MLELEYQGIPVSQLKLGMYVSRLDIPWERTHFPIQGILIRNLQDIEAISNYSQFVLIDEEKSQPELRLQNHRINTAVKERAVNVRAQLKKKTQKASWKKKHCKENYKIEKTIQKEMRSSNEIFGKLEKQISTMCEHTMRCRRTNVEAMVDSTAQIVESVIRNPDALAWLCRIRDTRKPIYMHTIRLAVWGGIVGRQLGMNRTALTQLCAALLMTGIGKSHISEKALAGYCPTKTTLDYQKHLHETLYQLDQMRYHSADVVQIIGNYCERIDGSGFPEHKRDAAIPFLARLSGLIETYELLINPYDASRAISPANAVVFLNRCKGQQFEVSLVEEFIKAIGIYPTGTLVELSDGQKGVVFSQNYEKRLRADVIPIISAHGNIIEKLQVLDLSYTDRREGEDDQVYIRKGVPSSNIPRGLLENAHNWMFRKKGVKSLFFS